LAAQSPVFENMFADENWLEGSNKGEKIIEIEDISAEAMEFVLRFVYSLATPWNFALPMEESNEQIIKGVLHAADKYMIEELKECCMLYLIFRINLSDEERSQQLQLAEKYRLDQLETICIVSLAGNFSFLKNEETRDQISNEFLAEIVDYSTKRQTKMEYLKVEVLS
jgi:hypothetical protein